MTGHGPRAVLVGPPGAGKTVIGQRLADRWGVRFRDTDVDIEQSTGRSISDLFVEQGEEHFRMLERQAVSTALSEHEGVLAVGGGAVMSEQVRQALGGHHVVSLEVGLAAAMKRLQMNRSRPLLVGNVRGRWQELADERRPLYEEVAIAAVRTDGLTIDQAVDAVELALNQAVSR